ncbi:hypothetical protein PCC7424_5442 (plasmid) [Gloeothece citriformis PCC 7424]|uniref:Uncharacterized protein n=1 Tax=Gloeothece citriformis (strain PCC 7424) TaxID=65393 RepID=B7KMJ4_GLOC7|nr:hypothetical protein PCC7424_5442 [Gloeothece citriformis PCC 7424]
MIAAWLAKCIIAVLHCVVIPFIVELSRPDEREPE